MVRKRTYGAGREKAEVTGSFSQPCPERDRAIWEDSLIQRVLVQMADCRLCPRECGVDRLAGERGFCGAGLAAEVFQAGLMMNEEADLNPCYEIFMRGCNLRCEFCYLSERQWKSTRSSYESIVDHNLFTDPGLDFARTVAVVGGEPSANLASALYVCHRFPAKKRVWNSNMYYSPVVAEVVAKAFDVVVADIHFGSDQCALHISGAENYLEVVLDNIGRAVRSGMAVIVRHLPLPTHEACCSEPILGLVAERFPEVRFNILGNYLPPAGQTSCLGLNRKHFPGSIEALRTKASQKGLNLEPVQTPDPIMADMIAMLGCFESGEITIEPDGTVVVPHLTPGLCWLGQSQGEDCHD